MQVGVGSGRVMATVSRINFQEMKPHVPGLMIHRVRERENMHVSWVSKRSTANGELAGSSHQVPRSLLIVAHSQKTRFPPAEDLIRLLGV